MSVAILNASVAASNRHVAKLVYVVPRQKGVRGRGPKARPKLAKLMLDRAMNPALERNRGRIEARFGQTLDRLCAEFNGSGNA